MSDDYRIDFTGPTIREPLTLWQGDTNYGPYECDCEPALPTGVTITSATGATYLEGTTPIDIITADSGAYDDTKYQCNFSVPSDATAGDYYMRLELQLSNMSAGETKALHFGPIKVLAWTES